MIDWVETEKQFGYNTIDGLKTKRPKVVCQCDKCSKQKTIAIRVKSRVINNQIDWLCSSCALLKVSDKISHNMKEIWKNEEYRSRTLGNLQSYDKEKHKINTKVAMKNVDMHNILKDRYANEESRQKMRESSKKAWGNQDLRNAFILLMNDEKIIDKISSSVKKLWKSGKYNGRKLGTETKSKISDSIRKLWLDKDHREKCTKWLYDNKGIISEASRTNWQKQEYRDIIISKLIKYYSDPTNRAYASSKSKELWESEEYRNKIANSRILQPRISSIQLQLYKYLDDLDITYHKEGPSTKIGYYAFDCCIPMINTPRSILIECQGDYWHSLPEAIKNDKSKFTYISKYFPEYEIMYIWEHEFNTKDRVLDRLKLKLGIDIETTDFNFRDIKISKSSSANASQFYTYYHYLSKGRGGTSFEATLGNTTVAMITYSGLFRSKSPNNNDAVEISRFCIHPSYHKKNFASWFLSKTLKRNNWKTVIAFADTTIGHTGTIYKAAGFEECNIIEPDFWYVDKDGYVMHKATLFNKSRRMSMTESEYATTYGYHKKYGGPKIKYILER